MYKRFFGAYDKPLFLSRELALQPAAYEIRRRKWCGCLRRDHVCKLHIHIDLPWIFGRQCTDCQLPLRCREPGGAAGPAAEEPVHHYRHERDADGGGPAAGPAPVPDLHSFTCDGQAAEGGAYVQLYDSTTESFTTASAIPPQGAGYIELVCMVPTTWQQIGVTYTPTFVSGKTLNFTINASDLTKA